ncbi:MAG: energy transducer TonB [Candidatus Omnitrophica bacterium]|nr:energy transducer TonB [Candidatus Omnitrophota bacterium]
MISDRLLRLTLVVSCCIHGAIILQSHNFNPFTPAPKVQEIAVRYVKENQQAKLLPKNLSDPGKQRLMPESEPFLKLDSKVIATSRRAPLPYIEQEDSSEVAKEPASASGSNVSGSRKLENRALVLDKQNQKPAGFSKPAFINSEVMAIKKKITLPAIEMSKINNPSYISYYQIVREKIRRSAYQNYTHSVTGEVYVSFIISNDGVVKDVRFVEEKTTVNDYLKNIALRSIRDASPFPNFPKELDYPQLSFNIIISFEIE